MKKINIADVLQKALKVAALLIAVGQTIKYFSETHAQIFGSTEQKQP